MVTGDSQEEVMIFRDTQTDKHFIIIYISSVFNTIIIIVIVVVVVDVIIAIMNPATYSMLLLAVREKKQTNITTNYSL